MASVSQVSSQYPVVSAACTAFLGTFGVCTACDCPGRVHTYEDDGADSVPVWIAGFPGVVVVGGNDEACEGATPDAIH